MEELKLELKEATAGLSYESLSYQVLGSTNDEALRLADSVKSMTIVAAQNQLKGRGRLERSWASGAGDIMMSIILKEPHLPECWWLLSMIPAVAILRGLESLGVLVKLKWPNDIVIIHQPETLAPGFADTKKLGGILVENSFSRTLSASIIGIGLNIEVRKELLKTVPHAGFLKSYSPFISRALVLKCVLFEFEKIIFSLKEPDFKKNLVSEYEENCTTIGRKVQFGTQDGQKTAIAIGLNCDGALVVNDGIKDYLVVAGDVGFMIS